MSSKDPGELEARLRDAATAALKAGDKRRRTALSSFTAALKKARIDSGQEPSEADELAVLKGERKRRTEAVEIYESAGRAELAEQERYEEEILSSYLPEELDDAALAAAVDEAIAATAAVTVSDMGKVMGKLRGLVADGRADGKKLSALVRERLGG